VQGDGASGIALDIDLLGNLFASADQGFSLCEAIVDDAGNPVDYRFLAVNSRFESMTGLVSAVGRTACDLVPGLEGFWIETYGKVATTREPIRFQSESGAMGRWFEVLAAPIGQFPHFLIVFRDITDQKRTQLERERALADSEALLQELNHRVMNSLGMIAAIIGLEARARAPGEGRQALERIGDRVHAVADLYRTLSVARYATEVRADDYLREVVERLSASLGSDAISFRAEIEPIALPTGIAAPLGLAVNELVTNSLKYAFAPGRGGEVRVRVARVGDQIQASVTDDGIGLSGANPDEGVGRKLVEAFARQLGGSVETRSERGTTVVIRFPLPE
jgi:two-component sensor histidine kinase